MAKIDKSIALMTEVIHTSRIIGPDRTQQAVIDARGKVIDTNIANLIIKCVCKEFKVDEKELIYGTSKGIRTEALMIGYVLAKKHLINYNQRDIAIYFKKDYTVVSKSITAFNRLEKDNNQDKVFIDVFEKISKKVAKHKKTWHTPEN